MTATAPLREVTPQTALFDSVLELIRRTSTILPDDVVRAVTNARKEEAEGSNADLALDVIGCNIGLAKESSLPLCQDTGTILFFVHTPGSGLVVVASLSPRYCQLLPYETSSEGWLILVSSPSAPVFVVHRTCSPTSQNFPGSAGVPGHFLDRWFVLFALLSFFRKES